MSMRQCGARESALGLVLLGVLAGGRLPAQVWEMGAQLLSRGAPIQDGTQLGWAAATGDFDGDGIADLVVGAPFVDVGATFDAGEIRFFLGSTAGLMPTPWTLNGLIGNEQLGRAFAVADFDGDGLVEVAVASPGFDVGGLDQSGMVAVYELDAAGPHFVAFHAQGLGGVQETAETLDRFGEALAAGDFDGDGYADLAVGVAAEDNETLGHANAGAVQVLYGGPAGLSGDGDQLFRDGASLSGSSQANAAFGHSLAVGDFDGDGADDLAIGTPSRDVTAGGTFVDAGELVILYGGANGLDPTVHQRLNDASFGGLLGAGDAFGWALAAGDFDYSPSCSGSGTCRDDLAIGLPGQPVTGLVAAGEVIVGYGSVTGIDAAQPQAFVQDSLGDLSSIPEVGDHFGNHLAVGELDGRPGADLVVGVPDEDLQGGGDDAGLVHLVFGGASRLLSHPGQAVWPRVADGMDFDQDRFGFALVAGDFNGRGPQDLAIGVPGAYIFHDDGRVKVLYAALFADDFETGDTSNWSDVQP